MIFTVDEASCVDRLIKALSNCFFRVEDVYLRIFWLVGLNLFGHCMIDLTMDLVEVSSWSLHKGILLCVNGGKCKCAIISTYVFQKVGALRMLSSKEAPEFDGILD